MPNARRRHSTRARLLQLVSLAALLVCAESASTALAAPAFYDGISADGKVAIFSSKEQMVPGDTDQEEDVYVRALDLGLGEYVTREVSIGPKGGNDTLPARFDGMSRDGAEVFFSTKEPIVAADADHREDVYVRDLVANTTALASQGDPSCATEGCGSGEVDSTFVSGGVAADGGRVFFGTTERLVSADTDATFDIYARNTGTQITELVSTRDSSCGSCVDEGLEALFRGIDAAGGKAFFTTAEQLAVADSDSGKDDIYQRDLDAGTTSLASVSGTCPPALPPGQNCEPSYGGVSADGSHLFFETNERLSGADTDSSQDVYDWSGGAVAALASTGPDGGNGNFIVTYAGASSDGGAVYFETGERLDSSADTDQAQDVYQRSGGATDLVSAGEVGEGNAAIFATFDWASLTGTPVVVFSSLEQLAADDMDLTQDVYARSGGVTTLISTGPEAAGAEIDAAFAGASADGSKIFFATAEQLVAADTDLSSDVYMRSSSGTVLVTAGQIGGNGAFLAGLRGVSADGSRAYFVTQERLTVDDDFAGEADIYSWGGSGTLLVSVKNSPDLVLGPPPPTLEGTTPASPGSSTTPIIFGQAEAGALIKIYRTSNCSNEPVAEGTAEELASPGLTVAPVAIGSTTNYRATAEAAGIVSACSSPISYRQEDPAPPPTGGGGDSGGGGGAGSGGGTTSPTKPGGSSTKTSVGGRGGAHDGIVYVAPLTRITFGPAAKTRLRRPSFRFADTTGQPGTKFSCRVDRKRWAACGSPIKLKKLSLGRHVFSVKAVNAIGTADPSPVRRAFKVVGR